MDEHTIRPLDDPAAADLDPLVDASVGEGFRFLARLRDEHASGQNRFSGEGEVLLGLFAGGEMVAVGGLNRDPYSGLPRTGRVRHVYVLPRARRGGAGRALMEALVARARPHFHRLVLRTDTDAAARFYQALGFAPSPDVAGATHHLVLTVDGDAGAHLVSAAQPSPRAE